MTIEPFNIEDTCAAGATEDTDTEIPFDGHFNGNIRVIFPPGPEGLLQLKLQILDVQSKMRKEIVHYGGNGYITGEAATYAFQYDGPVKMFEKFRVHAVNTDATNGHDWNVLFDIEVD